MGPDRSDLAMVLSAGALTGCVDAEAVETEAPLGPDQLRAGLRELVRHAQQEW